MAESLREKILELTSRRAMTIEEIAAELGGSKREIRETVAEMLRAGELEKVVDRERRKILIRAREGRS